VFEALERFGEGARKATWIGHRDPGFYHIRGNRRNTVQKFQNQMRLLKKSATNSSFLVGGDRQVCYSDVQEEHTE